MKISKSLIQAMALAATVAVTASSCTKGNDVNPQGKETYSCPACGMG